MNSFLQSLPPEDLALLRPHFARTVLAGGDLIEAAGTRTRLVHFPETATVILSAGWHEDCAVAVAIVGREGMLGWSAVLGSTVATLDARAGPAGGVVQSIDAPDFAAACAASGSLLGRVLRFAQVMTDQLASTAAAATHDPLARRLARWLLMLHDRQEGDELVVTHDDLAGQLGIRRASVTDCLHVLEGERVLRCWRGRIAVRDRLALERAAGPAYGQAEERYRMLVGGAAGPAARSGMR